MDDLRTAAERVLEFGGSRDAMSVARAYLDLLAVAHGACLALRSYQHGNASPELAEEVAVNLAATLARAGGRPAPEARP
jgi:hypothetical protein